MMKYAGVMQKFPDLLKKVPEAAPVYSGDS